LIVLNSASTPRKFVVSVSGAQFTYELPRASVATFVVPREVPAQRGVVRREDRGQPASIRR
jgi:hypothetical protein